MKKDCKISLLCGILKKKINRHNKTETVLDTENKQVVAKRKGVKGGKKQIREIKRYNF